MIRGLIVGLILGALALWIYQMRKALAAVSEHSKTVGAIGDFASAASSLWDAGKAEYEGFKK